MKFDLDQQLFGSIVALMRKAPVPHELSDEPIRAFIAQSQDPRIQSLQYPEQQASEEVTETKPQRRGRPPKAKSNGADHPPV